MGRSVSSSRAIQEKSTSIKNNPNSSIASARGRKPVATSTPYHGNKYSSAGSNKSNSSQVQNQQQIQHQQQQQQQLPEEDTIQQHMEVSHAFWRFLAYGELLFSIFELLNFFYRFNCTDNFSGFFLGGPFPRVKRRLRVFDQRWVE